MTEDTTNEVCFICGEDDQDVLESCIECGNTVCEACIDDGICHECTEMRGCR